MDIVLLGSGNVATHLGHALRGAQHRIVQVYSPTETHAKTLADQLAAEVVTDVSSVTADAAVYLIAIKDEAIEEVASRLPEGLPGIVAHTAGSVDQAILASYVARYGVIYPVQTFSKAKEVDFSSVPLAIEASDKRTYEELARLAGTLSTRVFACGSIQRLALHVAAVFACNFTNHLYAIGADILKAQGLDFELIRPLILETAEKAMKHQPKDVQTGPAIRNDQRTIQKHLAFLATNTDREALYALVSRLISG